MVIASLVVYPYPGIHIHIEILIKSLSHYS